MLHGASNLALRLIVADVKIIPKYVEPMSVERSAAVRNLPPDARIGDMTSLDPTRARARRRRSTRIALGGRGDRRSALYERLQVFAGRGGERIDWATHRARHHHVRLRGDKEDEASFDTAGAQAEERNRPPSAAVVRVAGFGEGGARPLMARIARTVRPFDAANCETLRRRLSAGEDDLAQRDARDARGANRPREGAPGTISYRFAVALSQRSGRAVSFGPSGHS